MRQHGHWHRFRPHSRKPCSCRWTLLAVLSFRSQTYWRLTGGERAAFAPPSLSLCYPLSSIGNPGSSWMVDGPCPCWTGWQVKCSLKRKCKVFRLEWRLHSFIYNPTELAFQFHSFQLNSHGFICVYWDGLLWMIWALPGDWLTEKSGTAENQSAVGGSYPNIWPIS